MDLLTAGALITAFIPFVTAGLKKLFTRKMPDTDLKTGVHTLIPIVLGILSTGLYMYQKTHDPWVALAAGLGSGGAASSIRDIDKNLVGIVQTVLSMVKKDGDK